MLPLLLTVAALAQEGVMVPAMRQVVALDATSTCPDVPDGAVPAVVHTTVGPLLHQDDGTYGLLCPLKWGGAVDAQVVASPDRGTHLVLADGALWRSGDGACSLAPVALPEGLEGVQLLFWRDAAFLLARAGTGAPEGTPRGALLRVAGESVTALTSWADFQPDGMAAAGSDVLWVAGAHPLPQVRRLSFVGGLTGDEPLASLPEDRANLSSLVPVAGHGDEAWLLARRSTSVRTWHARTIVGTANTVVGFTDVGPQARTVVGPARLDDRWVAVIDGVAHVTPHGMAGWTNTGASLPWTCLSQVGDRVFACTVPEVVLVRGVGEDGKARTRPVLSFDQVVPHDPACAEAACEDHWDRVAGALDLLDREEPAVCPDGRTLSDIDPQDCGCATGGVSSGGVLALGALALARRRRQSPRPNHA